MKQANANEKSIERTLDQQETLLVVDDEAAIRRVLCQKLSREGYQCEEADAAEQTLNMLETSPIALVILDIKMPGKSGIELLPEISQATLTWQLLWLRLLLTLVSPFSA